MSNSETHSRSRALKLVLVLVLGFATIPRTYAIPPGAYEEIQSRVRHTRDPQLDLALGRLHAAGIFNPASSASQLQKSVVEPQDRQLILGRVFTCTDPQVKEGFQALDRQAIFASLYLKPECANALSVVENHRQALKAWDRARQALEDGDRIVEKEEEMDRRTLHNVDPDYCGMFEASYQAWVSLEALQRTRAVEDAAYDLKQFNDGFRKAAIKWKGEIFSLPGDPPMCWERTTPPCFTYPPGSRRWE